MLLILELFKQPTQICPDLDMYVEFWCFAFSMCSWLWQELERKKQAEFEAQAKELELKAAEEKAAAAASNPELLEVKGRLDKLEVTVKEIVVAKKQADEAVRTGQDDIIEQKQAAQVEPDNSQHDSVGKNSKERGTVSNEGETGRLGPVPHASQSNQKENTKRGTFGEAKK